MIDSAPDSPPAAGAARCRHGDSGAEYPPRYDGPRPLPQALTRLALSAKAFTRDGPRADVEYRDLGWAAATDGAIGGRHIRAIRPFEAATGWHWHDLSAHFVCVLKGWIEFRYAGADGVVRVDAGSSLSQPAGVAHNVVGRSDDLELIEINLPAGYGTWDLTAEPGGGGDP